MKNFEEPKSEWSSLTSMVEILFSLTIKSLITSTLQNTLVYVHHKETHTGLERHKGEQMKTKFPFTGTIPIHGGRRYVECVDHIPYQYVLQRQLNWSFNYM